MVGTAGEVAENQRLLQLPIISQVDYFLLVAHCKSRLCPHVAGFCMLLKVDNKAIVFLYKASPHPIFRKRFFMQRHFAPLHEKPLINLLADSWL